MKSKELIKLLRKDGWYLKNQVGSHMHFIHPTKKGKVSVPNHNTDLKVGTLKSILKQAGL